MFGRFDDVTKSRAKLMKVEVYACFGGNNVAGIFQSWGWYNMFSLVLHLEKYQESSNTKKSLSEIKVYKSHILRSIRFEPSASVFVLSLALTVADVEDEVPRVHHGSIQP